MNSNGKPDPSMLDHSQTVALAPQSITPMEMLNAAVARGADLDVVTKLMDLQERWERTQARKAFDAAIAAAKAAIKPIPKNRMGHNGRKYADMAGIAAAVDPIISEQGLSYRYRTVQTDRIINVTCILSHRAGHYEETTLCGPADVSGSKNAIQAIGSTLTYLQRYSLMQALGLAATDDDDGESAGVKANGWPKGDIQQPGDYADGTRERDTKPPDLQKFSRRDQADKDWQARKDNWCGQIDELLEQGATVDDLDDWGAANSAQVLVAPTPIKEAIYRHFKDARRMASANMVVHDTDDAQPRTATPDDVVDHEEEAKSISQRAIAARDNPPDFVLYRPNTRENTNG